MTSMTPAAPGFVEISITGEHQSHSFSMHMDGDTIRALLMLCDGKVSSKHVLILPSLLVALMGYQRYGVKHLYSGAGPKCMGEELDRLAKIIVGDDK